MAIRQPTTFAQGQEITVRVTVVHPGRPGTCGGKAAVRLPDGSLHWIDPAALLSAVVPDVPTLPALLNAEATAEPSRPKARRQHFPHGVNLSTTVEQSGLQRQTSTGGRSIVRQWVRVRLWALRRHGVVLKTLLREFSSNDRSEQDRVMI